MNVKLHVAVFGVLVGSLASTARAEVRHSVNLPQGRLGDSLVMLGRQTGVSVGVGDVSLANEKARFVRGQLTVKEALRILLRGRNAQFSMIDPRTVRITRAAISPKSPVRILRSRKPTIAKSRPKPSPPPASIQDFKQAPEIVVVASRRSWPLKSYPGGVTIVAGDDDVINSARGTDALVSRLPTLGSTHLGPGRNKLFVRGIAESSFNGPTQATVGQYLGEARVNYSAPDPDLRLHDIERVELLAGPQGTLHGAGSLGGIIRVIPNSPKLERASGIISIAGTSTRHGALGGDTSAVLNAPLIRDKLGIRVSGYAVSEGGYIDDPQRGIDDVNRVRIAGARATVRSAPNDQWIIDLSVTGQRIRGEDAQFTDAGAGPLTRRSNTAQGFSNNYFLGNLTAASEWDDFRFVASAGAVNQKLSETFDTTRTEDRPAAYHQTSSGSLLSAEARLARGVPGGRGWLIGGTVLRNRAEQERDVQIGSTLDLRNRLKNYILEGALYGEGTVSTSGINATLGGRISTARLQVSGFNQRFGFPLPERFRKAASRHTRFLPAAAISGKPSTDTLLYARYQSSFRPGGLAIGGDEFAQYNPDRITSFETGVRYGIPGSRTLDVSAAIAYTIWSDVQADTIDNFAEITTTNIGDARIYTLDLSMGYRPLPGLALEAAATFNRSALKNLPAGLAATKSAPLPAAARLNWRLAAHYSLWGSSGSDFRISADARYTGKSKLGVGDLLKRTQGNWLDVSLLGQMNTGAHSFRLGVTNLFDTLANRFALGSPLLLDRKEYNTPVRPRTFRLAWEFRYGQRP
jgi:outer membrane receptor protein involved in Fe transport